MAYSLDRLVSILNGCPLTLTEQAVSPCIYLSQMCVELREAL